MNAVRVGGGDDAADFVAGFLAFQVLFKARDNIIVAMQLDERLALRAVDHLSLVVLEHVVYRDDAIFLDIHDSHPL